MKPIDYVPFNKMEKATLQNGQVMEYNTDHCYFCIEKQVKAIYKATTPEDIKQVLSALQNEQPLPEGKSIEEML